MIANQIMEEAHGRAGRKGRNRGVSRGRPSRGRPAELRPSCDPAPIAFYPWCPNSLQIPGWDDLPGRVWTICPLYNQKVDLDYREKGGNSVRYTAPPSNKKEVGGGKEGRVGREGGHSRKVRSSVSAPLVGLQK